jgi:hypothetical protein
VSEELCLGLSSGLSSGQKFGQWCGYNNIISGFGKETDGCRKEDCAVKVGCEGWFDGLLWSSEKSRVAVTVEAV